MRRPSVSLLLAIGLVAAFFSVASAAPVVTMIDVQGNEEVVSQHILGVVQTEIGEPLNQDVLKKDIEAIYGLGFFSYVDAKIDPYNGGASVTYVVTENPVVEKVEFVGNTVYSEEDLMKQVFTTPGTVFNRVFFRHDLQRIRDKFQEDGYVMMRIEDVQVEGGIVKVYILEPRIGEIVIQGNRKTKTYVVRRVIDVKEGDLFNSIRLRHSLNKIRALGYFEDVSVGFEPSEDGSGDMDLILTVKEQKTGRVSFSISHGSSSGWGGGVSYGDSNLAGRGVNLDVGFEAGDYEGYWASLSDNYMDDKTYAWKIGAYSREYEDRSYWDNSIATDLELFEYDEKRTGGYIGAGKKFKGDDKLSWFVTLDWHDSEVEFKSGSRDQFDLATANGGTSGTTFSVEGKVSRNNLDPYLSYRKGDIETIAVEHAMELLGGDWTFTKYWFEGKAFLPIKDVEDLVDINVKKDNPVYIAARIKAGSSSGTIPWMERYEMGGSTTLRGYESGQFKGEEMLLGNFELHVPIEEAFSFVLFYDIGNTEMSFSDMIDDYGFGVRVNTPLGNLRLDYANGDDDSQFHFGFGEIF
ncbi:MULTISPECIES: BamA/OMP85 family outer membrane protein [Dethiosulfovibrio]|uniref:BamA/TamA family outer membrane protein n=2 Tax=Dethiosulfovibrio TaxID=47054 RepID=A0ABS9EKF2_9BACT|nr:MULTISPECIES: BamA/TamA family outer membrane protein [Dethiosulfovibrio]MCF4113957.1 BamA/TamA family outer membrane protein [Dethiosulfovibrio russensis]MCF4141630.1 BamA/TamA family outer membrane protein [Dethiosulfovibrio marinus]MCF4143953.1 BamA/TamA family outer membrane protein [Dethiosulfovibrio acidaminovorans]